jgi:hypothetical protein
MALGDGGALKAETIPAWPGLGTSGRVKAHVEWQ